MKKIITLLKMNMIEAKNFALRLRKLREENGYSQVEFARLLGISRRVMCYYERESKNLPPASILIKSAELLNISLEDLLGLENKTDGRTIEAKSLKKLKNIALLPKEDRDLLFQLLDNLLKKNHILEI